MNDHTGIAADRLRSMIERLERLEREKRGLDADIRDVYAEAKGCGFDTKVIKRMIKDRAMDAEDRKERDMLADLYARAINEGTKK